MKSSIDAGKCLHSLFREVFRLHSALSEVVDQVHEQSGLRTPQVRLGSVLSRLEQATVPDIAHAMKVSRQYVQSAVNEMEGRGLVEFRENPRHKRSKLLRLTPEGREVLARTREREAEIIGRALPDVDEARVSDAVRLLEELREAVEKASSGSAFK